MLRSWADNTRLTKTFSFSPFLILSESGPPNRKTITPVRKSLRICTALWDEARGVNGLRFSAMFPNVEVRHLHAVIALGEELNFTKAALRLHLTQSALSRQITEIEKQLRFRLFTRDNRRVVRVELTDAGRVFVEEARSSLLHMERAFHLARTAHDGADNVLTIGHSHEADQAWVSDLLAVRLPLYPKLAIRLISQFSIELVRSV